MQQIQGTPELFRHKKNNFTQKTQLRIGFSALPWVLLGKLLGWLPRNLDEFLFGLLWPIYRFTHSREIIRVGKHLHHAQITSRPTARLLYRNLFCNSLDALRLLQNRQSARQLFQITNSQILQGALEKGKPIIVVSMHTGAFEAIHRLLTRFGRQIQVLTAPLSPPGLNVVIQNIRSTPGLILQPAARAPLVLRSVIRTNGILALMVDQSRSTSGVRTHFLGRPTRLFLRLVQEANQMGALVITCRCICRGGKHILRFENCYEGKQPWNELEHTLVEEFQRWVREYPEQWVWSYEGHWK